jgi:hypothetical protein
MVLSLEKKREIIVKNKNPALAAINGYLDKMYYLTDEITEKKKDIKDIKDEKAKKFILSLIDEEKIYERVRRKLIDDEELSLMEINYIRLAFLCSKGCLEEQIKSAQKAIELINEIDSAILEK